MNKKNLFLIIIFFALTKKNFCDPPTPTKKIKIAIISDLYIDSFYDLSPFPSLKIQSLPPYIKSGWDFYIGAKLALDSIQKNLQDPAYKDFDIQTFFYDTKKILVQKNGNLQLQDAFININYDLIIGNPIKNDLKTIAAFAKEKNIPFISVLFPQPPPPIDCKNFIMLNPTLSTYSKEIIKLLKKNNPNNPLKILVKDDETANNTAIKHIIKDIEKKYAHQKNAIQIIPLKDNFRIEEIITQKILPKNTYAFFILSLNKNFADDFLFQLTQKYPSSEFNFIVAGTPSWDNAYIQQWNKENLKVVYAKALPPHNFSLKYETLAQHYSLNYYDTPSDLFWIGYDASFNFIKRLLLSQNNKIAFFKSLSDDKQNILINYRLSNKDPDNTLNILPYTENQHLFFIQNANNTLSITEN